MKIPKSQALKRLRGQLAESRRQARMVEREVTEYEWQVEWRRAKLGRMRDKAVRLLAEIARVENEQEQA